MAFFFSFLHIPLTSGLMKTHGFSSLLLHSFCCVMLFQWQYVKKSCPYTDHCWERKECFKSIYRSLWTFFFDAMTKPPKMYFLRGKLQCDFQETWHIFMFIKFPY